MNRVELQRISTVPLPNPTGDQKKVNIGIIEVIKTIFKRDEDKEKRIRALEEKKNLKGLGLTVGVRIVTSDFSVNTYDDLIVCAATVLITATLFKATGSGRVIFIKNIAATNVVINGNSGDLVDGLNTQTIVAWDGIILIDCAPKRWIVT